ncbi:sigma-70 family RNA polymerase sigma factor [Myxacorys almedinensis]|uniref:sigma-70 family RNA polymerase sigma factor n=1 Tax=Myxacorys almedinensis TaxID=2651157 RepID=UPI003082D534
MQARDPSTNDSECSDNALIRQCVAGNADSFRWLYQRYHQKVRALLYQLCDAATLDDLVQEVFLRAWKGLPKFRQSSQFSTWLYRIACNVASDQRQLLAKGRSRFDSLKQQSAAQQDAPDLMHLHYQDIVQRGLQQLSFEHCTILVMHDLEDIAQKEIAEVLEIPLGTVKSRLFHARAAMRQFLHREGVQQL